MDAPNPARDRVPLGDLTNTTHGGNHNRLELVPKDGDLMNRRDRGREREPNTTMSGENSSERNKKHRQRYKMSNQENIDLDNNMAADSTEWNATNDMDEDIDWLHRNSTYNNSLELLSDVWVPLSNTGEMDHIDTDEDISTVHESGSGYAPSPINQIVTCPKERKRARDRARKAAMSPGKKALLNKRRRELYAIKNPKKPAKMQEMTPENTVCIGVPVDTDDSLTRMEDHTGHETGEPLKNRGIVFYYTYKTSLNSITTDTVV